MGELAGRLDVAMLPVWGWGPTIGEGHLNPMRAAAAAAILRPRLAIPIHWGTFYPAGMRRVAPGPFDEPGREFAAALAGFAPDVRPASSRPARASTCPSPRASAPGQARDAKNPAVAGGVHAWERGGIGQPNATWATIPRAVRKHHEDEEEGGEDANGVGLEVLALCGHLASPFGPVSGRHVGGR